MGNDLSEACGADDVSIISVDGFMSFKRAFSAAEGCLIIHTHGSPRILSDEAEGEKRRIVSCRRLLLMKPNRRIRFVFITACECAGGDEKRNIAASVSRKIAKNGAVIANVYRVSGASKDFAAVDGKKGWRLYRNGSLVCDSAEMPVSLTVNDAYEMSKK